MITLVVMTDGRRAYLERTLATLDLLRGPVSVRIIHDDSGRPDYAEWLWDAYGNQYVIHSTGRRSGFDGAMRSARAWISGHDRNPFVWWHEDDFLLTREIDLHAIADVLDTHPHITQMALRRQPINATETTAGGVAEQWRNDITEHELDGCMWLEHRRVFTTNPSLIPRRMITDYEWPAGSESEGRFGLHLFAEQPDFTSGFWGSWASGVWCEHIGTERAGTGY